MYLLCLHYLPYRLSLYLEETNITKMSQFKVNKIKMKWLLKKMQFDIQFPEIHVQAKYFMKGILGNVIPVHGHGPLS